MAVTELPPAWRDWLHENLSRGCDPKSLIADMIRNSFEPAFAADVVQSLAQGKPHPATQASKYVYETPRIAAGNLIHTPDRDVRVTLRIERPVVVFLDDVLSNAECDELVTRSRDNLTRSTTVDPKDGKDAVIDARTSEGTFFQLNADAFIAKIDRRVSALMNMPVENGEGLQILHYHTGGLYSPHFDFFAPQESGSKPHLANGGQRDCCEAFLTLVALGPSGRPARAPILLPQTEEEERRAREAGVRRAARLARRRKA